MKYKVIQTFVDGGIEEVRTGVSAEEAVKAFRHYSCSLGAKFGTTIKVVIIDEEDYIVAEWQHSKGIIFPPQNDSTNKLPIHPPTISV